MPRRGTKKKKHAINKEYMGRKWFWKQREKEGWKQDLVAETTGNMRGNKYKWKNLHAVQHVKSKRVPQAYLEMTIVDGSVYGVYMESCIWEMQKEIREYYFEISTNKAYKDITRQTKLAGKY